MAVLPPAPQRTVALTTGLQYQTCHRRFQLWQRSGRLDRLLQRLAEDRRDRGDFPIAVHVASASPYEPHLVPATLDAVGNYRGMVQLTRARILLRAFMR